MTVDAGDTGTQQTPAGQAVTMFTQDQVNHFQAEAKRGALNNFFTKELGLEKPPTADELKSMLAAADEHRKQQEGQKGDVERLTGQLATATAQAEKVPGLEQQLQRAQIAADAGLKSRYWKYIEGDDTEAITASVQAVLADVGGGGDGSGSEGEGEGEGKQQQQSGTGTGLTPNPQQGSGGGAPPKKASMSAGAAAYKAKHGEKE